MPQLCGSSLRSRHPTPTQHVSDAVHAGPKLHVHAPSEHVSELGCSQLLVQLPQYVALLCVSTQKPSQHIWLAVQKPHWPPPPPLSALPAASAESSSPPPAVEHPGIVSVKQTATSACNNPDVRM